MDGMVERVGVFALVGLASGFASGLFGIGGGIVRIPLFVYLLPLFGVAHSVMMHVAVGTSMALVLPSAIASTRKQLALGNLDLSFFRTWAVGILIGVLIGTVLLPYASTELLLLSGLRRPRDFRGDDADDHDRRPAGRAGRP
jgi:uncharacterized membrane protein YfcA